MTLRITLPAVIKKWVSAQIANGRLTSASDYECDLTRRDQEAQRKQRIYRRFFSKIKQ